MEISVEEVPEDAIIHRVDLALIAPLQEKEKNNNMLINNKIGQNLDRLTQK
jgi:hypothetical protein